MYFFEEKPRDLPNGVNPQDFWCRKQNYSINTQIIGNDQGLILDMDHRWAGRKHDARVWRRSEAKRYIENQPIEARFYLAADSAYPISPFLMKPFKVNEAAGDPLKRLFNRRLSGLRTLMSECIYGRWKRRFPVIKHIRNHTPLARDIILATAILHNLSIYWNEELPDDGDDNRDPVVVQPVLGPIQEEALIIANYLCIDGVVLFPTPEILRVYSIRKISGFFFKKYMAAIYCPSKVRQPIAIFHVLSC